MALRSTLVTAGRRHTLTPGFIMQPGFIRTQTLRWQKRITRISGITMSVTETAGLSGTLPFGDGNTGLYVMRFVAVNDNDHACRAVY
ncbi:hypothetical protein EGD84_20815 [Salmonella enterica]|nr:hypothetical protein [Salmonella enterica]